MQRSPTSNNRTNLTAAIALADPRAVDAAWQMMRSVRRIMNEHERHLISLLRNALAGDVAGGIKEVEAYYWTNHEAMAWDSKLAEGIHELAENLEYFELKAEWRTDPHPLRP